jgi:hypothetical protein
MKVCFLTILIGGLLLCGCSKEKSADLNSESSARSILLHELKTTHNEKEWFVPVNTALEGLTPEQAMWKDSSGNHSVGQLAYHLAFWNERQLYKFNHQPEPEFSGNNEETFNSFDKAKWAATVSRVDSVLTALEKAIESADEATLKELYPTIANISTHNAYHTGQIIYQRKLQGSWNPEKGVK